VKEKQSKSKPDIDDDKKRPETVGSNFFTAVNELRLSVETEERNDFWEKNKYK
jgi:hypothetical protein